MGANASNPNLTALLRQQADDYQRQNAAGALENAFSETDAKMRNQAAGIMGQQQSRNLNLASLSNSNSANSTNLWSQYQPRPSFWASLAQQGLGLAGQAGMAYLTGGMSAARPTGSTTAGLSGLGTGLSFYKRGGRYDPRQSSWQKLLNIGIAGEAGPELKDNDDGTTELVGLNGPEVLSRKPGDVLPADVTRDILSRYVRDSSPPAGGMAVFNSRLTEEDSPLAVRPVAPEVSSGMFAGSPAAGAQEYARQQPPVSTGHFTSTLAARQQPPVTPEVVRGSVSLGALKNVAPQVNVPQQDSPTRPTPEQLAQLPPVTWQDFKREAPIFQPQSAPGQSVSKVVPNAPTSYAEDDQYMRNPLARVGQDTSYPMSTPEDDEHMIYAAAKVGVPDAGNLPPVDALPALAHSDELADLRAQYARLREMYHSPVVNKNGRFKGALKSAGLMIINALATGQPLASAALNGIVGLVGGAADKSMDERLVRHADIQKGEAQFGRSLKAADAMAGIENKITAADFKRSGAMTPAQRDARRLAFSRFLQQNYPNGYPKGERPDYDAELDKLQMEPPPAVPKKPGPPFRPFGVQPGQLIVVGMHDGHPVYDYAQTRTGEAAPTMTDSQRQQADNDARRLALDLARYNTYLATLKQPPVSFDDWMAAGQPPAPASGATGAAPTVQPSGGGDPDNPLTGNSQSATPATAPTQAQQPPVSPSTYSRQPRLVPTGAKPAVVPVRGSYGGRRSGRGVSPSSSGGGSEKDAGFVISEINKNNNMAKDAESKAIRLRRDGYDDEAAAETEAAARYRAAAEAERQRSAKNPYVVHNSDGTAAPAGRRGAVKATRTVINGRISPPTGKKTDSLGILQAHER
jgi:hypothetical protein